MVELGNVAEANGIWLLDVGLSGGRDRAEAADLTLMVGGPQRTFHEAKEVLDALGSYVLHLGPLGAGSVVKLANNIVWLATRVYAIEALRLARAYGLSEEVVREAMMRSTGDCWIIRTWDESDRILLETNGIPSGGAISALDAARAVDQQLPAVAMLSELTAGAYEDRVTYLHEKRGGGTYTSEKP